MANMTAPNGTIHSVNKVTGKSHCGRVTFEQDGVTATKKRAGCGRCAQLSGKAPVVATAASTPAVKSVVKTPVRKGVKKAVGTVGSFKATITQDADVEDLYMAFMYLLDANKVKGSLDLMEMGTALRFEHGDYAYMVWHPRYNAGGADLNEWRIQWSEDFGSDDGVTEDFSTMEDALTWLIDDTGFKAAPLPKATTRKPAKVAATAVKAPTKAAQKAATAVTPVKGTHAKGAVAGHVRNGLKSLELASGAATPAQAKKIAAAIEVLNSII
jgi:hypothetical protein